MTAAIARRLDRVATRPAAAAAGSIPLDQPRCEHLRLRRGETLVCAGDRFRWLYIVRRGFLKSFVISADGLMQVTGFPMAGELVGLDGLGTGIHPNNVIALDDADVFVLPYARVEQWALQSGHAQSLMLRTLARELLRSQEHVVMLGALRAEQRVALFLLDLSRRYQRMGMSRYRFILRMTRQDIGSHLGLQLETVSRSLSRFHGAGVVQVKGKSIALLDFPALWQLSGTAPESQRIALDPIIDDDGCLRGGTDTAESIDSLAWQ